MEVDAAIVPGQTAIIDQPPGLPFDVLYHVLVAYVGMLSAGRTDRQ
jgi:hypothetical protein